MSKNRIDESDEFSKGNESRLHRIECSRKARERRNLIKAKNSRRQEEGYRGNV